MGDFAIRLRDGERIKIGTCGHLYYLRLEDKDEVKVENGYSFNQCLFRLPYPDEDHIRPGEYYKPFRGERLYKECEKGGISDNFRDPDIASHPGTIQLTHESGLLVNLPCYHGEKLPEFNKDSKAKAFWNGKAWSFELAFLKLKDGKVNIVVKCRHCNNLWSYEGESDKVLPYLHGEMKDRIREALNEK